MAARRDSKIVLLSFSGEAKVVPGQVFSVLRSVGLKVPGEVDALQRKPLRGMNVFDVRFTSEAARVRGVHVLEGVEGLKVTPYDSSVWVTVLHFPLDISEQVVVRTLGRFGKVIGYEEPEFLECKGVKTGTRRVRVELKSISPLPCPDRSYAARVATSVVEAVPVPASDTVSPDAPLIAPVSDTSAPVEALNPLSCPISYLNEVAETAILPTGQNGGVACRLYWFTGSCARYRDTSAAPSQLVQETLSGPDSDSTMEDCTTVLRLV
ncbi:putative zinc finger CCHC domain-containing protein 3-like [Apostichopus japonicus]|uniref:Putative zinc finger CCHC domain-containing protein 3-like n=1 Tax=Stichopus japonicus TaxID=307972 RepID=A0A2G8KEQ4_STIJA|nr:putative zinc finger CCHC domain-containing protein 3-like [Apostichopus japonicus]